MAHNVSHIVALRIENFDFPNGVPSSPSIERALPDDYSFGGNLSWCGDFSGSSWRKVFLGQILPASRGTFEGYVVWEGGDSITGLRVVDGVVTEPDVVVSLEA